LRDGAAEAPAKAMNGSLLGHKSLETKQIYVRLAEGGGVGTRSPLDIL
jgi:hypothetical protein